MSKKYVQKIVKKLNCSKKKREEIGKQLSSEIETSIEMGESMEEIIKRMGTPEEIAEEFNSSFSKEEQKKHRKEKWGHRIAIAWAVVMVLIVGIYWAFPKNIPIEESKRFQKEAVQTQAEQVVKLLNEDDYETLEAMSDEQVQSVMNEETMGKAKENFGTDWGEFKSFGNIYLAENTQMGKHMAVAQMNASYENASVTYTILFDEDMKITGLWMK